MSTRDTEYQLTVEYLDMLSAVEVAPLIDVFGSSMDGSTFAGRVWPGYFEIRSMRRPAGPMASGFLPDPAVLAIVFASQKIAEGFLEEIGKEGLQYILSIIHRIFIRGAKRAEYRASNIFALTVEINGVPAQFRVHSRGKDGDLSEEELLRALQQAKSLIATALSSFEPKLDHQGQPRYYFEWHPETDTWSLDQRWGA